MLGRTSRTAAPLFSLSMARAPMQIAVLPALERYEPKALLLSGMLGLAAGTVLWHFGVGSPWRIIESATYAGCGGLTVWILQRNGRAAPLAGGPISLPPVAAEPPQGIAFQAAPQETAFSAAPVGAALVGTAGAAEQLGQLDAFFSVTERQLLSVVSQTESAAGDIIMALQAVDAAQSQSAACVSRTRSRMVDLAGESDAALRGLEEKLAAYLRERLDGTRTESAGITQISEQMLDLSTLTAGLEKVGSATRMLALNANIEATRAGSYGAGFQVIARELQILAQGSQEAVMEARRRVTAVQQTIDGIVDATRDVERNRVEEARINALIGDLNGIVGRTTQTIADMAQTELSELAVLSDRVGDQVLTVFGQVQFQDVVRQQIEAVGEAVRMLHGFLGDLQRVLDGQEPDGVVRAELLMEAVRARYVTQIQWQTDAQAVGTASEGSQASVIELF